MSDIVNDLTEKVKEQRRNIERKTLSVKEFSEIMGVGESTARQMCRRADAPVIRTGNRYRIIISRIDEWLPKLIGQQL